jgi:cephalosporin-C deacetylase-like acetyl esterase
VITSLGGKSVYDFNRAQALKELGRLEARRRASDFRVTLAGKIRSRLALPPEATVPRSKTLPTTEVEDLVVEKLLLETEPGISVPIRVIRPKGLQGRGPAVVYLRDRTGEGDLPALFASLAEQGHFVAVADVRGFGETWAPRDVREETEDYFHPRDGNDSDFAYATFFLGRPLLGMRAADALGVVRYLRTRWDVDPKRIAEVGRGAAGLAALFAASLDSDISSVAVEAIPASYGALAEAEIYQQPAYLLLPGVLQDFDLNDVFAALAPRPLLVLNPQDPLTRKMVEQEALAAFEPVRSAYDTAKASAAFTVRIEPLDTDVPKVLEGWLRAHE